MFGHLPKNVQYHTVAHETASLAIMYQSVQDDMTEYRAPLLQQPDGRREEKSKAAKEDPHELSSGFSLHQRRNENLQKIERFSMLCKRYPY
ncbi:hypothetical protein RB213_013531 [Colletotrichum asianum]